MPVIAAASFTGRIGSIANMEERGVVVAIVGGDLGAS
jgi:hypothetical protein